MDSGKRLRLNILNESLNRLGDEKFSKHKWTLKVLQEVEDGEYLLVEASRFGYSVRFALLYSSGTKKSVYKALDEIVDLIIINGSLYKLESFAYGIKTKIISKSDVFKYILQWNEESESEKQVEEEHQKTNKKRKLFSSHIQSENPIEQLWARVKALRSKDICRELIRDKVEKTHENINEDIISTKSEGIAFCLQNACDYFEIAKGQKLNQKITSLYYGAVSLASAEMLSGVSGPNSLEEIEKMTKFGHGLFTVDMRNGHLLEDLLIGSLKNGFFKEWMNFLKKDISNYHDKREKKAVGEKFDPRNYVSLIQLISRIPEIEGTYFLVTKSPSNWFKVHYDSFSNDTNINKEEGKTYIKISDPSCSKSIEDIKKLPFPLTDIQCLETEDNELCFRALVTHEKGTFWHSAIDKHRGPYSSSCIISPVFKDIQESKVISLILLYALSILVRYRPSIWRRVESGDFQKYTVVIEEFLEVYCRCAPHHFLEDMLEERVTVTLPGGFNSLI